MQLGNILERFIQHLDKGKVEMLKLLAVPRRINYEIAECLLQQFLMSFSITSLEKLMNFSFIDVVEENKEYIMHELMRKSLVEEQDVAFVCKVHECVFAYYRKQLEEIGQPVRKIKLLLNEYIYHGMIAKKELLKKSSYLSEYIIFWDIMKRQTIS